jgi:hypothetical protein
MNSQELRLIKENPNLSSASLSRLTGIHQNKIQDLKIKSGVSWTYRGHGIPFLRFINAKERAFYLVSHSRRAAHRGNFSSAIENVDRLIYCLENNSGKLPPTGKPSIFEGLGFLNKDE